MPRGHGTITIVDGRLVVTPQMDDPAPQRIDPDQIFSYFKEFPVEIRLKIWCSSFTPRRVNLREGVRDPTTSDNFIDRPCRRAKSELPPTLFANRESREETLRHYCRLMQPLGPLPRSFPRATLEFLRSFLPDTPVKDFNPDVFSCNVIYWHPKIDSVFICTEALHPRDEISEYLNCLFPGSPGSDHCIDNIKDIELYETRDYYTKVFTPSHLLALLSFRCLEGVVVVSALAGTEREERRSHNLIVTTPHTADFNLRMFNRMVERFEINHRGLQRFGVRTDERVRYYIEKNMEEDLKLARRLEVEAQTKAQTQACTSAHLHARSMVPMLAWVGWYGYCNRHNLKLVAGFLFGRWL